MKNILIRLSAGAALSVFSQAAFAQDATNSAPAPSTTEASSPTNDIIVTATRRSERLQDVSIAATAISGDNLDAKGVTRQLDLQNAAPGLSIVKAGLTESINIRGIGLASGSPQVANGVANYLDGVFQPPIVSSGTFYDIGSIEVLRGPQGTLVGSNSTGGAIFINTRRPVLDKFSADFKGEYGSFNHYQLDAALNIPLSKTLALRLAGITNNRDSYYTDVGAFGNKPDSLNERDGRVSLLWKPSEQFQAYLKSEFIDRNSGGYAWQPIATTTYAAFRTNARFQVNYNTPEFAVDRAFINALELKYVTGSGITIRSLSGYQNKRLHNRFDADAVVNTSATPTSPNATRSSVQNVREREFTEEINIISPAGGAFSWILGGYYQRNLINVRNLSYNAITNGVLGSPGTQVYTDTNKTVLGAFAQLNFKLSSTLSLEAGARYSHFSVKGSGCVDPAPTAPGAVDCTVPANFNTTDARYTQVGSETDGRLTGKVSLNFKPDQNNLFYVFAARGYKPGGINPGTNNPTFLPETVWDFEGGWKSSFLDRHITTQIGAFYNSYRNFQQSIINTTLGNTAIQNIPTATIKGFEAQIQARLGGFAIDGGFAYTASNLGAVTFANTRTAGISNPAQPQCVPAGTAGTAGAGCYNYVYVNGQGGSLLFAPKVTWNAGIQYDLRLGDGTSLIPRVNYSYVGSQWTNLLYSPVTDLINAHGLLNAELTFKRPGYSITAFATNLTNAFYISGQSGNNEFYGAPREYGVRVAAHF